MKSEMSVAEHGHPAVSASPRRAGIVRRTGWMRRARRSSAEGVGASSGVPAELGDWCGWTSRARVRIGSVWRVPRVSSSRLVRARRAFHVKHARSEWQRRTTSPVPGRFVEALCRGLGLVVALALLRFPMDRAPAGVSAATLPLGRRWTRPGHDGMWPPPRADGWDAGVDLSRPAPRSRLGPALAGRHWSRRGSAVVHGSAGRPTGRDVGLQRAHPAANRRRTAHRRGPSAHTLHE